MVRVLRVLVLTCVLRALACQNGSLHCQFVSLSPGKSRDSFFFVLFRSCFQARPEWDAVPLQIKPDKHQFLQTMIESRAESTSKRYVHDIRDFVAWCHHQCIDVSLPMQAAVVALYLFQKAQSGMHSATLVRKGAALKWFHSFAPSGGDNPLDDALCLNILEQVKRCPREPIAKKTP